MSSPTLRLFINGKREATAVHTTDGTLLQVYPMRQHFADEQQWRQVWERTATFRITITENSRYLPAIQVPPAQKPERCEDWAHKETTKCVAPPGSYYIGDLCYALSDDLYDTVFGRLGGYDAGMYAKKDSTDFFFLNHTDHGDGMYAGSDCKDFAVDAGIIGICPVSLLTKDGDGGHVYTFTEPVRCLFRDGSFLFRSATKELLIDTE